ncbi:hypothetical protein OH76DRAFT_1484667 [Lentinus brumalis]|uniref:RRM domain-containing protein n=1 Tax=Lentinus brumalis TaxID=2498619 RepID=A0A371D4V5_9APHY|nr:hypothetical protein OH76DRAFT_1484667 [Polyporus brumalis]
MSATVLASARSVRSIALSRHGLRSLVTEAVQSSSSTPPPDDVPQDTRTNRFPRDSRSSKPFAARRDVPDRPTKSVYVRSWDPIANMAEFYAMLRGVEKRFGTVREFRLARDGDVSSLYQGFFLIEFADDASLDQIPEKGTNVKVEVPVTRERPGGIGLADLQGLLQPQERDWTLDASGLYGATIPVLPPTDGPEKRPTRVVELVVQRTKKDHWYPNVYTPRGRHLRFGTAFAKWGGFYQPTSSDDRPISKEMAGVLSVWNEIAQKDTARRQAKWQQTHPTEAPDVAIDAHEAETFVAQEAARDESAEADATQPEPEPYTVPQPEAELSPRAESQHEDVAPVSEPPASSEPHASSEPLAYDEASVSRSGPATPRLSRKQKILALAREHARAPMPDAAKRAEEAEEARRREEEARNPPEVEVKTMRERLMKLMGRWS